MNTLYAIISVLVISVVSLVASIPLLLKKKISNHVLLFLLSASVGVLLGTVFIHFIPEIIEQGYSLTTSLVILGGFLVMFIIEKFIHFHHSTHDEKNCGHGHAYSLAPLNLIGDGVHNFIDGLVVAGAYAVSPVVGISATISIIFHEIPQEIADLGVLLYAGMSKKKAVLFNFLSALSALGGVILGLFLTGDHEFTLLLPFAAGNFIYIAASNLVPQLHRHCKAIDTLLHIVAIILGICIVFYMTQFVGH